MQERGRERARVCERVYVREQKVLLGRAEQRHVIIARCEFLVMLPILRLCEGERVCIVGDSSDGEQGMLDMLGRVLRSDDTHPSAKNTTAKKKCLHDASMFPLTHVKTMNAHPYASEHCWLLALLASHDAIGRALILHGGERWCRTVSNSTNRCISRERSIR